MVEQVDKVGHVLRIYIEIEVAVEVDRYDHIAKTEETEKDSECREREVHHWVKRHAEPHGYG
jgi:hypothetical protein